MDENIINEVEATEAVEVAPAPAPAPAQAQLATDEAKQLILKEREERVKLASKEVQEVLDRNKCTLDVSVTLRAGQVIPEVQIVAVE
jgi:hypothetical protein